MGKGSTWLELQGLWNGVGLQRAGPGLRGAWPWRVGEGVIIRSVGSCLQTA